MQRAEEFVVVYCKYVHWGGSRRVIGFLDGHVEGVSEEEFQEIIEKNNVWRGELGLEEIKVFTTQLRTIDNKTIIIPNAKLTGDNITNYSAKDTRRVDILFGVSYTDDLQKVRQALQSVVEKELRILDDPPTAIIVKELADSSVNFEVRAWVKTGDYWDVYFDTVESVKKRFDAEGISIPFPQRDVHMYKTE